MTHARRCVFLALLVFAGPRGASAQGGLVDFFESLSGPGPFTGLGVNYRIACMKSEAASFLGSPTSPWVVDWTCLNDQDLDRTGPMLTGAANQVPERIRQIVELRVLKASTPDTRPVLLADPTDKRNVGLLKVDVVAAFRLTPFLDVGGGGGYIGFDVDGGPRVHRPVIVPISITYTPGGVHNPRVDPKTLEPTIGARFRRFIRIRLDVNYIPFGFTGESWGRPDIPENVYSTDGNWVMSGGLVLDVGTFLPVNR